MLGFEFFYDVATYANENWKGKMSPKEVAYNAYEYTLSYEESKANGKPNAVMESLCEQLLDDAYECGNNCPADRFYMEIVREGGFYYYEQTR